MMMLNSDIISPVASCLPVQVNPSPVYPGRQVHVKLPTLLVQLASALQPPLFVAHSSTSALSEIHCGDYNVKYFKITAILRVLRNMLDVTREKNKHDKCFILLSRAALCKFRVYTVSSKETNMFFL